MGVKTLKDGTQVYDYPRRRTDYAFKGGKLGGARIFRPYAGSDKTPLRVVRPVDGERESESPDAWRRYWVAPEQPDGSLGKLEVVAFPSHIWRTASFPQGFGY